MSFIGVTVRVRFGVRVGAVGVMPMIRPSSLASWKKI